MTRNRERSCEEAGDEPVSPWAGQVRPPWLTPKWWWSPCDEAVPLTTGPPGARARLAETWR